MDSKKILRTALVVIFFTAMIAYHSYPVAAEWGPAVREIIAANRAFDQIPDDVELLRQVETMLYNYQGFADAPSLIPLEDQSPHAKALVTKQGALEDVEFLIRLLKYGYAGYEYYGGDARFHAAKDMILQDLHDNSPNRFKTDDFQNLLYKHLNFINDGHFQIGTRPFLQEKAMYMDFKHAFTLDERGFLLAGQAERAYLQSINGKNPQEFMYASLDHDGEVVYRIGILEMAGLDVITTDITLVSGKEERKLAADLAQIPSSPVTIGYEDIYTKFELDGITVLTLSQFPTSGPEMEQFCRDAELLKDQDAIIIDLRSNFGGSTVHLYEWLDAFTEGRHKGPGWIKVSLCTPTSKQLALDHLQRHGLHDLADEVADGPVSEIGWSEIGYLPSQPTPNRVNVVVLTGATLSAGEVFVNNLIRLDNVVVLGTNTKGAMLMGYNYLHPLPHSQLAVRFGADFCPAPDLVNREGIGYLPDFWVSPQEALDLAIKFIHNYAR